MESEHNFVCHRKSFNIHGLAPAGIGTKEQSEPWGVGWGGGGGGAERYYSLLIFIMIIDGKYKTS